MRKLCALAVNEYIKTGVVKAVALLLAALAAALLGRVEIAGVALVIFAASIIPCEYIKGTVKTMLLAPTTRTKIILAKYIVVLTAGLLMAGIFYFVPAIEFGEREADADYNAEYALLDGLGETDEPEAVDGPDEPEDENIEPEEDEATEFFTLGTEALDLLMFLLIATFAFTVSAFMRSPALAAGLGAAVIFLRHELPDIIQPVHLTYAIPALILIGLIVAASAFGKAKIK